MKIKRLYNSVKKMGNIMMMLSLLAVLYTTQVEAMPNSAPFYNLPAFLSAISPDQILVGSGAFTVTVTGTNFLDGAIVRWDGIDLVTTFIDATQLSAEVPAENSASAGTHVITVFILDGGLSNELIMTVNNPNPNLSTISPDQILVGSGAFTLTVTGSDFVNGSIVRWNGGDLITTFIDATQLSAAVPADNINTAGGYTITIFNPYGGSSVELTITVQNPAPILNAIAPDQKVAGDGGFTLVVNGENFISNSQVLWNGVELDSSFINSTQLQATIPSHYILNEGYASIVIRNPTPGGGTTTDLSFTILPRSDTWMSHSPEGGAIVDVEVDTNNPTILYAGTAHAGLYKSTDGGQIWFAVNNGIDSPVIDSVAVSPTNSAVVVASGGSGIYLSVNGGSFWKKVFNSNFINANDIKFDPQHGNIIYATSAGLERSIDSGKTWQNIVGNKLGPNAYILEIAVDGQHSGTVYVLNQHNDDNTREVWKTENGGTTWTKLSNGLPNIIRSIAIHPTNPDVLLIGTEYAGGSAESGIYRSEDAGATWIQVLQVSNYYTNIVFNQSNPDWVYAATGNGVYTSTDGGQTWQPASGFAAIMTLDVDPSNPALLYGGGSRGMYRSIDAGATWSPIDTGLHALLIMDLEYALQNSTFFAATWEGGLWKSTDYGANWYLILDAGILSYINIDPNNPDHVFAGYEQMYDSHTYESLDGGQNWSLHDFTPASNLFGFASNSDLYSGQGLKVYKSTDDGNNWVEKSNGLPECTTSCRAKFITADPLAANTLYVGMSSWRQDPVKGFVVTGYLYKTTDGGENWVKIQNGITTGYLNNLTVDPIDRSILYLSTFDGIFKSTNGGDNWIHFSNLLSQQEVNVVAVDPLNNQMVYAGTEGKGVYHSKDGGATWSEFNYGMNSGYVRAIIPITDMASASTSAFSGLTATGSTTIKSRLYSVSGGQVYAYFSVNYEPTTISLAPASVPGKMPVGTKVGTFTTSDPNVGESFSYTLISGSGDTDNASFTISGNTLRTAEIFDQSIKNSYSILVRSSDSGGLYLDKAFTITITTNSKAPLLLSPVNGAQIVDNQPVFDWEDVAGAASYTIQISKYQNFSLLISSAKAFNSTFTPTASLPSNRIVYWRVRMNTASKVGPWSLVYSFKTPKPPSIPVLIAPANNALVKIYMPKLDWSNSTLPTGTTFKRYELQVDDNYDFSNPEIEISTTDSVITQSNFTPLTDLAPNTKYFWRVRSVNLVGTDEHVSGWSAVRSFRTVMLPPTLLLPVDLSTETSLKPIFDWDDVDGATSYTIQISTSSGFGTFLVNLKRNVSDFTPTTNLPKNKLIYWRVRANGPNGPSVWSTFQFTTPP